jgi:prepilin-type N-terminal cleavage/methylation domain-containing protein/prepilin-type processing-associated H-X9-DG protein
MKNPIKKPERHVPACPDSSHSADSGAGFSNGAFHSRELRRLRSKGGVRGFTLVELMVTITIVVILAAIAMVASSRVKKKALQAKALAPIRDVSMASAQYATENFGRINTIRWPGDKEEGKPFVGNSFWGRLQPYLFPDLNSTNQGQMKNEISNRLDRLFSTKDADIMTGTLLQGSKIYHDSSGLPVPFAFNEELYTWNNWENTRKVGGLSEIMYITYGFGLFNEADGESYVPRPTDGSKPDNNIYYLDDGRAMVAFLDGHVESIAAPIPSRRFKKP